jgi:HTH-type transcriptional regulator / antitoxin HigA
MKVIKTKKEYYSVMAQIETYLEKGFKNLTKKENEELRLLSLQIEAFEKIHFPMPVQHDLTTLLDAYMRENHLTKQQMAVLLEVEDSTLKNILSKKKPLTLSFAKQLHQKIHLDGNLILEMA